MQDSIWGALKRRKTKRDAAAVDPADAALAYAIWDSENTVRLEYPEDFEQHLARARSIRHWLRVHKHDVKSTAVT
jgi:hypothetical protein